MLFGTKRKSTKIKRVKLQVIAKLIIVAYTPLMKRTKQTYFAKSSKNRALKEGQDQKIIKANQIKLIVKYIIKHPLTKVAAGIWLIKIMSLPVQALEIDSLTDEEIYQKWEPLLKEYLQRKLWCFNRMGEFSLTEFGTKICNWIFDCGIMVSSQSDVWMSQTYKLLILLLLEASIVCVAYRFRAEPIIIHMGRKYVLRVVRVGHQIKCYNLHEVRENENF